MTYSVIFVTSSHCSAHAEITDFHKIFWHDQNVPSSQVTVNKMLRFKILHSLLTEEGIFFKEGTSWRSKALWLWRQKYHKLEPVIDLINDEAQNLNAILGNAHCDFYKLLSQLLIFENNWIKNFAFCKFRRYLHSPFSRYK